MRLIDVSNTHFPLSRISHVEKIWNEEKREAKHLVHFHGTSLTHEMSEGAYDNIVCGAMHIVQIIEPRKPYYVALKYDDGSIHHEKLDFLALCADGFIKGVWLMSDGMFEIVDHFSNFKYISEHSTPEEHVNASEN